MRAFRIFERKFRRNFCSDHIDLFQEGFPPITKIRNAKQIGEINIFERPNGINIGRYWELSEQIPRILENVKAVKASSFLAMVLTTLKYYLRLILLESLPIFQILFVGFYWLLCSAQKSPVFAYQLFG